MLWAYPPTRTQLAFTLAGIATGGVLISAGAYLSYANIGPQQARIKARGDLVRRQIRKMLRQD